MAFDVSTRCRSTRRQSSRGRRRGQWRCRIATAATLRDLESRRWRPDRRTRTGPLRGSPPSLRVAPGSTAEGRYWLPLPWSSLLPSIVNRRRSRRNALRARRQGSLGSDTRTDMRGSPTPVRFVDIAGPTEDITQITTVDLYRSGPLTREFTQVSGY